MINRKKIRTKIKEISDRNLTLPMMGLGKRGRDAPGGQASPLPPPTLVNNGITSLQKRLGINP